MKRSSVGSIDKPSNTSWSSTSCDPARDTRWIDEIELVGRPLDAVVVDGHAQVLAATGLARLQTQHLSARGNIEHRARRAIRHANDDRGLAAVPEEMLHGQRDEAERAWPPKTRLNSSNPLMTTGSFNGPRSVRPMNATTVGETIGMTSAPSLGSR